MKLQKFMVAVNIQAVEPVLTQLSWDQLLCSEYRFMQVKLKKDFLLWDFITVYTEFWFIQEVASQIANSQFAESQIAEFN